MSSQSREVEKQLGGLSQVSVIVAKSGPVYPESNRGTGPIVRAARGAIPASEDQPREDLVPRGWAHQALGEARTGKQEPTGVRATCSLGPLRGLGERPVTLPAMGRSEKDFSVSGLHSVYSTWLWDMHEGGGRFPSACYTSFSPSG